MGFPFVADPDYTLSHRPFGTNFNAYEVYTSVADRKASEIAHLLKEAEGSADGAALHGIFPEKRATENVARGGKLKFVDPETMCEHFSQKSMIHQG